METNGKTSFTVIYVMVFFVLTTRGISSPPRIVGSIKQVVTSVSTFSSSLDENYSSPELENVEQLALQVVEKVPVIGEAISTLSEAMRSERDIQILKALQTLSLNLNTLSNDLDVVKKIVASIPHIIQISIIQKQVAEDGREIENCYNNYGLFLEEPHSTALKFRLLECYGKIQFLREIGDILIGKVITFDQQSIFDEIISTSGTCNGTEITSVFKYIYGLYIKGCISISMAEKIKFSSETIVSRECKSISSLIFQHLKNIYLRCQNKDLCDENGDADRIYNTIGENTDLKLINGILQREFPWYYFTIIATENDVTGNFSGMGYIPSMMTLKIHEHNYVTVIWFPEKSNVLLNDSNSFLYEMELHQLYRPENGLHLSFSESTDYSKPYTTVSGRVPFNSKLATNFMSCRYNRIYISKSPKSSNVEKKLSTWDKFMNLPLWERCGIGFGIVFGGLFVVYLIPKIYKKIRNRIDDFDD